MDQEVKKKWVDALRSGRYEQGTEVLHTASGRFCCLGVLCDIAVQEGIIPEPELDEAASRNRYRYGDNISQGAQLPPPEVVKWAGWQNECPNVEDVEKGWIELTVLNDDHGLTFTQIADIVEKQPPEWKG